MVLQKVVPTIAESVSADPVVPHSVTEMLVDPGGAAWRKSVVAASDAPFCLPDRHDERRCFHTHRTPRVPWRVAPAPMIRAKRQRGVHLLKGHPILLRFVGTVAAILASSTLCPVRHSENSRLSLYFWININSFTAIVSLEKLKNSPVILSAFLVDGLDNFQLVRVWSANSKYNTLQSTEVISQYTTSPLDQVAYQIKKSSRTTLLSGAHVSQLERAGPYILSITLLAHSASLATPLARSGL